jgi:hypothetical protein
MRTHVPEWWQHHSNLALLYRHLVQSDQIDPAQADEVAYFLEKPWKWQAEWAELTTEAGHGD